MPATGTTGKRENRPLVFQGGHDFHEENSDEPEIHLLCFFKE